MGLDLTKTVIVVLCSNVLVSGAASALKSVEPMAYQIIFGNPSQPVCPTANCPAPPSPPILATQIVHGQTSKPAGQPEWLSTLGLYVDTGAQQVSDPISGQKVAQYIGVLQASGAGTAWAMNTDIVRNAVAGGPNSFGGFEGSGTPGKPGAIGDKNGTVGYELDFTNWDSDSGPGSGAFTVGQYVHAQGSYTSLGAIYLDAYMAPDKKAWHAGLFFNGHAVIGQHAILDASDAVSSYTIRGHHRIGFDASEGNADMRALVLAEGQTACLNRAGNCLSFRDGRLRVTNTAGKTIFSIDDNGNVFLTGKVKQEQAAP